MARDITPNEIIVEAVGGLVGKTSSRLVRALDRRRGYVDTYVVKQLSENLSAQVSVLTAHADGIS